MPFEQPGFLGLVSQGSARSDHALTHPGCVPWPPEAEGCAMLQAIENGAAAFLRPEVEGSEGSENRPLSVPVIQLPNPCEAMGRLGAAFYNEPSQKMTIVGVSGQLLNKAFSCVQPLQTQTCATLTR